MARRGMKLAASESDQLCGIDSEKTDGNTADSAGTE